MSAFLGRHATCSMWPNEETGRMTISRHGSECTSPNEHEEPSSSSGSGDGEVARDDEERARAFLNASWIDEVEPNVIPLATLIRNVRAEERQALKDFLGADAGIDVDAYLAWMRGQGPEPEGDCCRRARERERSGIVSWLRTLHKFDSPRLLADEIEETGRQATAKAQGESK